MHAQYVTAHVTLAVLSIACCVFAEFILGVRRMPTLSCAGFCATSPSGITVFKAHNVMMRHGFEISGCAMVAAATLNAIIARELWGPYTDTRR